MEPSPRQEESVAEFTLRAALAGIVFGIMFGAANAYLGLESGSRSRPRSPSRCSPSPCSGR